MDVEGVRRTTKLTVLHVKGIIVKLETRLRSFVGQIKMKNAKLKILAIH